MNRNSDSFVLHTILKGNYYN